MSALSPLTTAKADIRRYHQILKAGPRDHRPNLMPNLRSAHREQKYSFSGALLTGSRNNVDLDGLCFDCRRHGINRRCTRPRLGSTLSFAQSDDITLTLLCGALVRMGCRSARNGTQACGKQGTHRLNFLRSDHSGLGACDVESPASSFLPDRHVRWWHRRAFRDDYFCGGQTWRQTNGPGRNSARSRYGWHGLAVFSNAAAAILDYRKHVAYARKQICSSG
jgi:hypothetical protein